MFKGLRIHDLIGLVVGYGLAAVLVRRFWSTSEPMAVGHVVAVGLLYLWAGLTMSGPFVLLLDRRGPVAPGPVARSNPPSRYSGEETAWIGIGGYFVAIALFVLPARHRETPWSMLFGPQAIVAVLLLIWLRIGRRTRPDERPDAPRWTRRAAAVLLATWPVAWLTLILLLK
jgi:hypothetical protein